MASIKTSLSSIKTKDTKKTQILFRVICNRSKIWRIKSGIYIPPNRWNEKKEDIQLPRIITAEYNELIVASRKLEALRAAIITACVSSEDVTKEDIEECVRNFHNPKVTKKDTPTLMELIDEYLNRSEFSISRIKSYKVVRRTLLKYHAYSGKSMNITDVTSDLLIDFIEFLKIEHTFFENDVVKPQYAKLYELVPESRQPRPRGTNYISSITTCIRAIVRYAISEGWIISNPFDKVTIKSETYGTPFYITIDERNTIYSTNLEQYPHLAIQRDIFVFQCVIGCRVSDLCHLTKNNVIEGMVEYIPRKTKEGRPVTVRVPLNTIAQEIVAHYKDCTGKSLLPFISSQKYNDAIKEIFTLADIKRIVTVLNPTTGEEEQRPINEIASSHLARRTFIGNIYKQVKDPNLVGALSGHKEGSKAFARYREIDDDIKRDLVKMLE